MSTVLQEREVDQRPKSGGIPARRAIVRWGWRAFQREWRQQTLVLGLLITAVALLVAGTTFVYKLPPPPEGEFGNANRFVFFGAQEASGAGPRIEAAKRAFGTIEVIGLRHASLPGSLADLAVRSQDPDGVFGAPMLEVVEGRFPTARNEVAITDKYAAQLNLTIGGTRSLDGRERRVVGIVENPGDLESEFVLVAPEHADTPDEVRILFNATDEQFNAFASENDLPGDGFHPTRPNDKPLAAALALALATVFLLFVSLVAAAGFAVLGQRRLRQLGMLGAIGASEKHLRGAMATNGAAVGLVAAVIGLPAGIGIWFLMAPLLEAAEGHRAERLDLPWLLIASGLLIAILAATAAAWWPARALARVPVSGALSSRPPSPRPVHRSALAALAFFAIGITCLIASNEERAPFIIAGSLSMVLGIVFVGPIAIRTLTRFATPLPLAGRLALRDLGRYQARSGAALAAISLALGIAMTIVLAASTATDPTSEGNLAPNQMLIFGGISKEVPLGGGVAEIRGPESLEATPEQQEAVESVAAGLDDASVVDLHVAYDPKLGAEVDMRGNPIGPIPVDAGRPQETTPDGGQIFGEGDVAQLFVATPELIAHYDLDTGDIPADADVMSASSPGRGFQFLNTFHTTSKGAQRPRNAAESVTFRQLDELPDYTSLPTSLLAPRVVQEHGWGTMHRGWLVESASPLTNEQIAGAIEIAAAAGIEFETRDDQTTITNVRNGAFAGGALLALGILAMTIGLIRAEAAADMRTLSAAGGTRSVRRRLTAATAASLALLGVLIGTAGAYLFLGAWFQDDLGRLARVPVLHLVIALVGIPLLAGLAGSLLSGRELPAIARRAME